MGLRTMNFRNTDSAWGSVSMGLHWLIVLLFLVTASIGLVMDEMPNSMTKVRVYAIHKSLGLTILALMVVRLLWRLAGGRPRALAGSPRWQTRAAETTHWLLYATLLAMPLSGWLYNSASGFALQWFGLFNLPALSVRDDATRFIARDVHGMLFYVILALVAVHAGAALWHHLVRRDDTLDRMLPARLRRATTEARR